jgi:hypothetical protein
MMKVLFRTDEPNGRDGVVLALFFRGGQDQLASAAFTSEITAAR